MTDPAKVKGARSSSKQALVEAAFEEFSSQGYEATTVARIAEQAGVTTGAVYAHFRSKVELLAETLGLESVSGFWRVMSAASTMTWSEASKYLSNGLSVRPDRRAMLLLLDVVVVARSDSEVAESLRHGLSGYLNAMEKAAEVGIAEGLIDPALDPPDLARLFAVIAFGLLVFDALDEAIPSDAAFVRLTDVLLQGALNQESSSSQPAALSRVRLRAIQAERARRELGDAVAQADRDGLSLRQIGAAANLSHERIRRLLQELSS